MVPYSQAAAALPGTMMMFPTAQQIGAQVNRAPLRELYSQDPRGWPGLENRPPRSHAPSQELVRSIAEREYWRQQSLAQEGGARRQDTDTESMASTVDTTEELRRVPRNQTFTKRLTSPAQDPTYREEQLQAARTWFEDRRSRLVPTGGGSTSR